MRSTWSEPYLWLHLAGLAAVPLLLEGCLLGLKAVDSPLALIPVALVGIGPIVWMQWNQPFSVFSLTPLVLQPNRMTETQRRILAQFKAPVGRGITVGVAALALVLLWQLQQWLPFVNQTLNLGWLGGLGLACLAFFLSHLFLQVPASVVPVLLTPDQQLAPPHPVSQIPRDFTLVGLGVKQILPTPVSLASPASAPLTSTPPAPTGPSAQPTDLLQEEKRAAVTELEPSDLIQAELVDPATASVAQPIPERIQAELISTEADLPKSHQADSEAALAEAEPIETTADPVEAVPLNAQPIDVASADGAVAELIVPAANNLADSSEGSDDSFNRSIDRTIDRTIDSFADDSVTGPVEPAVEANLAHAAVSAAVPVEPFELAELDSESVAALLADSKPQGDASSDSDGDSDGDSDYASSAKPDNEDAAPTARVFLPQEFSATEPPALAADPPDARDTVVTVGPPLTNPFDEPAAQLDPAVSFEAPSPPHVSSTIVRVG